MPSSQRRRREDSSVSTRGSPLAPAGHSGENPQKFSLESVRATQPRPQVHLKFNSDPYPRALPTRSALAGGRVPGCLRVSALKSLTAFLSSCFFLAPPALVDIISI